MSCVEARKNWGLFDTGGEWHNETLLRIIYYLLEDCEQWHPVALLNVLVLQLKMTWTMAEERITPYIDDIFCLC